MEIKKINGWQFILVPIKQFWCGPVWLLNSCGSGNRGREKKVYSNYKADTKC